MAIAVTGDANPVGAHAQLVPAHQNAVTVRLRRLGPSQYSCGITAHLLPNKFLAVDSREDDLLAAIDRAVLKITRAAERTVERYRVPRARIAS